ncbi:F-box domain-containing protein [Mycena sanguinolenta]|uniref:F-box domain-containing protein n=1 Tax=Mycena sanguinolenta TaxID=230812 RepID=A0A8H7D9T8_9AGAR|nr:F-box domain-containing protein [Mycena sanguinolenta]
MLTALAADRARIPEFDAKILVLERSLSELRVQRAQAQKRLDSFKYPILTLPNEITTEIFLHFLPAYPNCPRLAGRHSPALLTEISREWRAIALEIPALWGAIFLPSANIPFRKQASLLNLWLSRSKCCPLSIYINDFLSYSSFAPEALSCVAPHRARWENLVLYAPKLQLSELLAGPMPLLRRLDLLVEDSLDGPMTRKLEAPMLRTVLLNDIAARHIIFPWAQLTALALDKLFPRECTRILQHTVNLIHCELGLATDSSHQDVPAVTLLCLQTLTLTHVFEGKPVTGYLQTLILPALQSLRVPASFLGLDSIETLQSFVSKSGCTLQELCITRRIASGSNASYYTAFPSTKVTFDEWTPCLLDSWLKFS